MCMSLCSDSVKRGLSHWIPQPSTSLYQLDWMSVFTSGASHWPEVLNFSFCTSFCKRKPTEVSDSRPGLSDSIAQEAEISHNYHMIIISMAVIVVYVKRTMDYSCHFFNYSWRMISNVPNIQQEIRHIWGSWASLSPGPRCYTADVWPYTGSCWAAPPDHSHIWACRQHTAVAEWRTNSEERFLDLKHSKQTDETSWNISLWVYIKKLKYIYI